MEPTLYNKVAELEALVKDAGQFIAVSPERCLELCTAPEYKLARTFFLKQHPEETTRDLFVDLESAAYDALCG